MDKHVINRNTMLEAAHRYADFDKSDPFTMSRIMTHINNGIASITVPHRKFSVGGYYDAKEIKEKRSARRVDGSLLKWEAVVHRHIVKP